MRGGSGGSRGRALRTDGCAKAGCGRTEPNVGGIKGRGEGAGRGPESSLSWTRGLWTHRGQGGRKQIPSAVRDGARNRHSDPFIPIRPHVLGWSLQGSNPGRELAPGPPGRRRTSQGCRCPGLPVTHSSPQQNRRDHPKLYSRLKKKISGSAQSPADPGKEGEELKSFHGSDSRREADTPPRWP